jgi:hypothetical protein
MDFNRLFKVTFDQFVKGIVRLLLFNLVGCLLCFTIVLIPTVARGLTRGMLRYAREGIEPEFDELWRFDDYLQVLLLMVLGGVAIALGLLLLIVPGVVLMVLWMYALVFLVDRNLSFSQAMGASKQLVGGSGFWNHLVILLVVVVLNSLAGGLAGLGTLLTAPFALLLVVNAYLMSTGQPATLARPEAPR